MMISAYFFPGILNMSYSEAIGEKTNNWISTVELRRLLIDLKEKRPGVFVRFRLIGELWAQNFLSIAGITENGVLLKDERNNTFIVISNLTDIIQFEIDEPFHSFRPYNHYDVKPSVDF
jgi:hypothetical protein